ncbi:MAG: hypothetical protein ABIH86_01450 [Planctomycetota bacterium]
MAFLALAVPLFSSISAALDISDPLRLIKTAESSDALANVFVSLTPVFINGDVKQLDRNLSDRVSSRRRREIIDAVTAETKAIEYRSYSVDALTLLRTVEDRIEVRADMSWSYRGRGSKTGFRDSESSYVFHIVPTPDGGFAFLDAPGLFDTIGLSRNAGFLAIRFFAVILLLLGVAFWLWMIFDCFHLQKRHSLWRVAVVAAPFIGGLVWGGYRLYRHLKRS